ncbi:transglutaminase domain-containing protein [Flavobacterium gelatinilyticum]|uniref:transglutaminase domain-containing protein n=1 Tax=Flavobacterium gelatinilyticum TaxID=3003260 RepID=UPI00247FD153|nr:transglutaminase domain-containing protein [Flavobacterium gelatinilyticum]
MIIKKIAFVFLFLNVGFITSSYSQKYNAIDSIILKYPHFGNPEKLAERIQKDFISEHDKARAIYSWIALNLNYDVKTYLDPPKQKTYKFKTEAEWAKKKQLLNAKTIQKTFNSKKAVCEGFALLYEYLATLSGLKCQTIVGDSKTLLNDIGRKRLRSNHAWNTVQINGKWILLDVTWGNGFYNEKRKVVIKEFTPIYFDMNPDYFYAKHFPENAMYSGNTGNREAFLNGPILYDGFFMAEAKVLFPFSGIIQANDGDKMTFKFKNVSRLDYLFYLNKKEEQIMIENAKEEDGVLEFQITYDKKMGRFITFFLFDKTFATFKIVHK